MGNYRQLQVWQRAMELAEMVYAATRTFPKEERFGLTAQLRSSVVSIPSNIAEGEGRRNRGDVRRFLSIAIGSLLEVETQLELAKRVGLLEGATGAALLSETAELGRMLNGLRSSLRTSLTADS